MEEYGYIKSYMDYVEKLQDRKLVLFGAGDRAPKIIVDYYIHDKIEFICDNNSAKWGTALMNIPICSPDELLKNPEEYVVLITIGSGYLVNQITHQLKIMEIPYVYNSAVLSFINEIERYDISWDKKFHELNTYRLVNENQDKIQLVRSMLRDEKSQKVYDACVLKMKYNMKDYRDICDDVYDHYFSDGVFEYQDNEVFVDGGAYDGEDSVRFSQITGEGFKKTYCFEPDPNNFLHTCENLSRSFGIEPVYKNSDSVCDCSKFTVFKSGLFNKNEGVGFASYGLHCSRFEESRHSKVSAVKLDDVIDEHEKITLLKLDVEGTEIAALEGAEKIIKRDKPKMAICIYHNVEDLWEIPLYIKSLVPDYKFYVRHHTEFLWDKVLYVTV